MTRLLRFLDRVSTGRRAAVLFLVAAALFLSVNLLDFPLSVPYMVRHSGHAYLDMQGFYTADRAYQLLEAFGPGGRRLQLWLLLSLYVVLPLAAAAFGTVAVTFLYRAALGPGRWPRRLVALPLAALLADLLENTAIVGLVLSYPRRLVALAATAGVLTAAKGALYLATAVAIQAGLALAARSRWRSG